MITTPWRCTALALCRRQSVVILIVRVGWGNSLDGVFITGL